MKTPTITGLALVLIASPLLAQQPAQVPATGGAAPTAAELGLFIYPAKDQTKEQQAKDEQECYAWAGE